MFLELENVTKRFDERVAVNSLSLKLEQGKLLCILGASGCGKTTTLNMIGGFLHPDSGRILLDGIDITNLPPESRPVATVFQSYGLFPHLNVLANVMYGLKRQHLGRAEARERALRYLKLVGLEGYEKSAVQDISGGQQQRVALARSLAVQPKLLLLDEPLSNLDAGLRTRMRRELKELQQTLGITMVFVTHDQEEALVLADKVAIMNEGRLLQYDSPKTVYQNPAEPFVADFLSVDAIEWRADGSIAKVIAR